LSLSARFCVDVFFAQSRKWRLGEVAASLPVEAIGICTKQTRIHRCPLPEIWMEGERHTYYLLCLWRDKLSNSVDHSLTCKPLGGYTSM